MPRVGSKQSIVWTPSATQRAIVTFCWLPPDSRRTSLAARVSIWSRSDRLVDHLALGPEVDQAPAAEPGRHRQSDVLPDGPLHEQGLGAIGRHVHEAGPDGVGRMAERDGRAVDDELAAVRALRSGQDVEQLVLALALEGDDAEDLARIEVERHVV